MVINKAKRKIREKNTNTWKIHFESTKSIRTILNEENSFIQIAANLQIYFFFLSFVFVGNVLKEYETIKSSIIFSFSF